MRRNENQHRALGALVLASLVGGCGGGGGRDEQPPIGATSVEMRIVGLPARGVQVGRPFALRVELVEPGTANGAALPSTERVSVRIVAGAGVLSGTTEVDGGGATSLVFGDLAIDSVGEFQLEVSTPRAVAPVVSAPFRVGARFDLAFVAAPDVVFAPREFSVRIAAVDPNSGVVVDPGYPVDVTLSGPSTSTLPLDPTAGTLFANLASSGAASDIRVTATAFGFPSAQRTIPVETLTLQNVTLGGSDLVVGGDFTLTATVVSSNSGQPVSLVPPLSATVTAGSGAGVLSGAVTSQSSGSRIEIGPMRYDASGEIRLDIVAPELEPVAALARFGYELIGTPEAATTGLPNRPIGPVAFRLQGAAGIAFAGIADPMQWRVVRDSDSVVVASGSEPFVGGVARISPAELAERGTYRLIGTPGAAPLAVGGPAEVGLEVAFNLVDAPGPFVALASVRADQAYSDSVEFAALPGTVAQPPRFGLLRGALPLGLALDESTGAITGSVAVPGDYEFVLWARQSASEIQPLRCSLSVFQSDESDVTRTPPNFGAVGPDAVGITSIDGTFSFTSSFDGQSYSAGYRVWVPPSGVGPAPLLVLHHGRDMGHLDYELLGQHLASWGVAFGSVSDSVSFRDSSGAAPNPTYDLGVIEAGMQSGAAFLEGLVAELDRRNAISGDSLESRLDLDRVFVAGHGRGGGCAHGAHVRTLINKARGYVYLGALDLRFSPFTEPPGDPRGTPMYAVPSDQPRAPQLVIAAENDGDIFFPLGDQFAERRVGPTTFVTVYGGCSSFMTDARSFDAGNATITRQAQHDAVFRHVTAFIKRWSGDRSLDALLYGDLSAGSTSVGVFGWRNMSERVLIDDFQDGDPATNALGFPNSLSAGSRTELSVYPNIGAFGSLGIRQSLVFLSAVADAEYTTGLGNLDLTPRRKLAFRLGQLTNVGFDWVSLAVRFVDANNASSAVTVWDRQQQTGSLPDFVANGANVYDRFVEVEVPLDRFNGIDLSNVMRLDLLFETDGMPGVERQIYFDDLRVE